MFGLGTWEIILILVVALVFIGPDKLPQVARSIGKGMRSVRSAMSQVDHEVRRAANDFVNAADDDEKPPAKPVAAPSPAPGPEDHPVLRAPDDVADGTAAPPGDADAGARQAEPSEVLAVSSANAAPAPPTPTNDAPPRTLGSALAADRDWRTHINRPVEGRVAAARPGRRPSTVVEDAGAGADDDATAAKPADGDDDSGGTPS